MKNYLVSENELKALLADSMILEALENGGVDNWRYYGNAIQDFIEAWKEENCANPEKEDWGIEDIAEAELEGYAIA